MRDLITPLPLFLEFCAGVMCPPCAGVLDGRGVKLRGGEILNGLMQILFLSFIFPSFSLSSSSSSSLLFFILAFSDFPFGLFLFSFSDCKHPSTSVLIFL